MYIGLKNSVLVLSEITESFQSITLSRSLSSIIDVAMDGRWIGIHFILYSFVYISKGPFKMHSTTVDGRTISRLPGKIWMWKMNQKDS